MAKMEMTGMEATAQDQSINDRKGQRREAPARWVWILTCRRCRKMTDFDQVCVPARRLREWAMCCGEVMELKSVLRDGAGA